MTDEEIIATAEATGLKLITLGLDKQKSEFLILAFAKLVAAKEREAVIQHLIKLKILSWDAGFIDLIRTRGKA